MKRTLPSFSLEGKVAVVTGGARGLGLVMGQALVQSGADLAIVDLDSQYLPLSSIRATRNLLTVIQKRKASTKPKS
jgi:D-arabinitol 2-dehydrogenase